MAKVANEHDDWWNKMQEKGTMGKSLDNEGHWVCENNRILDPEEKMRCHAKKSSHRWKQTTRGADETEAAYANLSKMVGKIESSVPGHSDSLYMRKQQ